MLQGYLDAGCPVKEAAPAPLSDQDDNHVVTTLIIGCGYLGRALGRARSAVPASMSTARCGRKLEPPRSPRRASSR